MSQEQGHRDVSVPQAVRHASNMPATGNIMNTRDNKGKNLTFSPTWESKRPRLPQQRVKTRDKNTREKNKKQTAH
jgi:hypothetical protein